MNKDTETKQIYIIKCNECYKVGISNNPQKRLKELQTSNPYKLTIINTYPCDKAIVRESIIHMKLNEWHIRGEWFSASIKMIEKAILEVLLLDSDTIEYKELQMIKMGKLTNKSKRGKSLKHKIIQENKKGEIELTKDMIRGFMTAGAGLSKWKANLIGLKYPLKRGWVERCVGKTISIDSYNLIMGKQ